MSSQLEFVIDAVARARDELLDGRAEWDRGLNLHSPDTQDFDVRFSMLW
jgi:hypothetical protein